MKYMDFYKECGIRGQIPEPGLCNCFGGDYPGKMNPDLQIMSPLPSQLTLMKNENIDTTFWGTGYRRTGHDECKGIKNRIYGFTPLRQTIVLFMAAMNNEL